MKTISTNILTLEIKMSRYNKIQGFVPSLGTYTYQLRRGWVVPGSMLFDGVPEVIFEDYLCFSNSVNPLISFLKYKLNENNKELSGV